jgi:hypothetical protein
MLLKMLLLHARLSRLYPQVKSLFSVLRRLSRCAGLVLERHNHRVYVLRQAGHLTTSATRMTSSQPSGAQR